MSIQEDLVTRTKAELKQLAKFYKLKGAYKLRKLELCEALSHQIQEKFMYVFEMTSPGAIKTFDQIIKMKDIEFGEINPEHVQDCMMLKRLGILEIDMEKESFFVHPEIVQAYQKKRLDLNLQRAIQEKQRYYSKLKMYKDASIHLYGVIELVDFIALYEQYEGETLDKAAFFEWLERDSAFCGGYYYENGYLIDESFSMVSEEEFVYFFHEREDKAYYRPSKEEFLRYADEYYYEETSEVKVLRDYLNKRYPNYKEEIEDVILDMILARRYEIKISSQFMQDILTNFEMIGIHFNTLEEVKQLSDLVVPVLNHTRIWINKGHSPKELRKDNLSSDFKGSKIVISSKVGRNDPCPCGSGLKYKKCCGK